MTEEIKQKIQSVQGLKSVHELLLGGMYPGAHSAQISNSIKFIEALHASALADLKSVYPEIEKEQGAEDNV